MFVGAAWQPHDTSSLAGAWSSRRRRRQNIIMCGIAHLAAPIHPITTSLSTTPIAVRQQLHTYTHTILLPSIDL